MENCIKLRGIIVFDPKDVTNKQKRQSSWKKVSLIMLESNLDSNTKGISEYYSWFIKKRFGIILQKPLRGAHVTLVNDKVIGNDSKWEKAKKKWDKKEVDIYLNVDPFLGIENRRGNYEDWWLTVPYEYRTELEQIRKDIGLSPKPRFGFHMTIGTAKNFYPRIEYAKNVMKAKGMFKESSEYILKLAQNNLLNI